MISVLTLPDHSTHRHKWYGLSCERYEGLLAECGQRCQTCGCPSEESARTGKLAIDHDHQVGNWAVRGLLCTRCNATLRQDRDVPEWAREYIADPWYIRMLNELGLPVDPQEPEGKVRDPIGNVWRCTPLGWTDGRRTRQYHSWGELLRRFGPHNLSAFTSLDLLLAQRRQTAVSEP